MSLDKAIQYGKENRKRYKGAKAVDTSCRNHGSCDYCKGNRIHKNQKRKLSAEEELQQYEEQYGVRIKM